MSAQDSIPSEQKLTLGSGKHSLELEIDFDGDLCIDPLSSDTVIYIDKAHLPALRDWLNKVVEPVAITTREGVA